MLLAIFVVGCDQLPTPQNKAKQAVASLLNDPQSAQFSDFSNGAKEGDFCGYVNAKNRFGAYVGKTPFAYRAETDFATIAPHDLERRDVRNVLATGADVADQLGELHKTCSAIESYSEICERPSFPNAADWCKKLNESAYDVYEWLKTFR